MNKIHKLIIYYVFSLIPGYYVSKFKAVTTAKYNEYVCCSFIKAVLKMIEVYKGLNCLEKLY